MCKGHGSVQGVWRCACARDTKACKECKCGKEVCKRCERASKTVVQGVRLCMEIWRCASDVSEGGGCAKDLEVCKG